MANKSAQIIRCHDCWSNVTASEGGRSCQFHRKQSKPLSPIQPQEPVGESDTSEIVTCISFSPETSDGEHWCPIELSDHASLVSMLTGWVDQAEIGDVAEIRIVRMSKRALERLPSI